MPALHIRIESGLFFFLLSFWLFFWTARGIKTGTTIKTITSVTRSDDPFGFWCAISFQIALEIGALLLAFYIWWPGLFRW